MVDRAIIKLHGSNSPVSDVMVQSQQMPAPCHKKDDYMGYLYPHVIPVIMALAWLFTVAHGIKNLTAYKECGLEEVSFLSIFLSIHRELFIRTHSIPYT